MNPIRILLVDDHSLIRLGLTTLLKFHPDFKVVGCAENGLIALQLAREQRPDLIIMDLVMPDMDGVETTRRIKEEFPEMRILILTSFGQSSDIARALQSGAGGALLKDTPDDQLLAAIRTVASGGSVFSPSICPPAETETIPTLTDRQTMILDSAARGLTNLDIARQFGISSDAVKQHLTVVFRKLGAANRAEAIAIALRHQLLKR